jgi:hypothetical protein
MEICLHRRESEPGSSSRKEHLGNCKRKEGATLKEADEEAVTRQP